MGEYFTSKDVRERFAKPLSRLGADFDELCRRWEKAYKSDQIVRPDLLLNQVTSEAALGTLQKFLRDASGKLDDAIAGVYRYRDVERRRAARGENGTPNEKRRD